MPEWFDPKAIWLIISTAISFAAAVAAVTPSMADDKFIQRLLDIINSLGLNVLEAKNKDDNR